MEKVKYNADGAPERVWCWVHPDHHWDDGTGGWHTWAPCDAALKAEYIRTDVHERMIRGALEAAAERVKKACKDASISWFDGDASAAVLGEL